MAGRTKALGAALVTALACAGLAAAAFAGVDKYDTKLTIGQQNRTYFGQVKSKVHKCEQKRQVVLFALRPGEDRKVGHDRSGPAGQWFVRRRGAGSGDRFYAKVRRKSGNGYVCRADRAPEHGVF
jgi:hypothetical protein